MNRSSDVSLPDEFLSSCNYTSDALDNTLEDDTDSSDSDHDSVQKDSSAIHVQNCSRDGLQKSSALFLLGLKEKHKLTQATVQSVVKGVTNLTQQQISILKSQVCSYLARSKDVLIH